MPRLNTHMQHIESLVMFGKDGLKELNNHLLSFINRFNDTDNGQNVTTKIDGAPALQIYSCIGNGYPNKGVGLKSVIKDPKNVITSVKEAEAKYGDRPNMVEMIEYALEIAPSIPEGEIWQGDCLFTSSTKKEKKINGEDCIVFQPNKVVYSFSEDNPGYGDIKNAKFGICFHTIYKLSGDGVSQSFKVDPTVLNAPSDIYIMSPVVNMANAGFDIEEAAELYDRLLDLESKLTNDSYYNDLTSNEQFMKFWSMFENHITSDKAATHIDAKTFIGDLTEFVKNKLTVERDKKMSTLKTDAGKQKAQDTYQISLSELEYLIEQRKQTLVNCVNVFNAVVDLKMKIFEFLKDSPKGYSTYLYKNTGEYEPTSGEGWSMSDSDGNIVKIVDRSEFAHANRDPSYLAGFEHESLEEDVDDNYIMSDNVKTFINSQIPKVKKKIEINIKQLLSLRQNARRPLVDYLRDGIYELRTKYRHDQYRILYFFFDGNKIIFTNAFIKNTDSVPNKEIEKAIAYRRNYNETR